MYSHSRSFAGWTEHDPVQDTESNHRLIYSPVNVDSKYNHNHESFVQKNQTFLGTFRKLICC